MELNRKASKFNQRPRNLSFGCLLGTRGELKWVMNSKTTKKYKNPSFPPWMKQLWRLEIRETHTHTHKKVTKKHPPSRILEVLFGGGTLFFLGRGGKSRPTNSNYSPGAEAFGSSCRTRGVDEIRHMRSLARFRRGARFRGQSHLKILVGGGWSEDLDGWGGRFFWKILSRQSLQHSFQWTICHELVYVVRYVFFFRFFWKRKNDPLTHWVCWRSCKNFSKRFEESILQWIKFFETTQDCSRYKSNCFLAILRTWPFLWRDGELKTWPFSLVVGDLRGWKGHDLNHLVMCKWRANLVANWSLPHFEEGLHPPVLRSVEAWRRTCRVFANAFLGGYKCHELSGKQILLLLYASYTWFFSWIGDMFSKKTNPSPLSLGLVPGHFHVGWFFGVFQKPHEFFPEPPDLRGFWHKLDWRGDDQLRLVMIFGALNQWLKTLMQENPIPQPPSTCTKPGHFHGKLTIYINWFAGFLNQNWQYDPPKSVGSWHVTIHKWAPNEKICFIALEIGPPVAVSLR